MQYRLGMHATYGTARRQNLIKQCRCVRAANSLKENCTIIVIGRT